MYSANPDGKWTLGNPTIIGSIKKKCQRLVVVKKVTGTSPKRPAKWHWWLTRFVVQNSYRLDDVDRVNETVLVNVHAESGQMAGVAQRRELLLAENLLALHLDDVGVHHVAVVQRRRERVFRVTQSYLNPTQSIWIKNCVHEHLLRAVRCSNRSTLKLVTHSS